MTVQLNPDVVPPGYLPILSQNRAFPVSRIVDVQGQLSGGTIIYLEGGREVSVRTDVNTVLRAIDEATWGEGIEVADDAPLTPQEAIEAAVSVVQPKQLWLNEWSSLSWLYGDVAERPEVACGAQPNHATLARMRDGGTVATTSCIYTMNHGRSDHLTIIVREGVAFDDPNPTLYAMRGSGARPGPVRA